MPSTFSLISVAFGLALLASPVPAAAQNSMFKGLPRTGTQFTFGDTVANTAMKKLGQKFGRGECTDFVDAVFAAVGAKPGHNYVWGEKVDQPFRGYVIQFWDTHYTLPNGSWGTAPGGQHTAIVGSANGTLVTLVHQNDGARVVTTRDLDLSWPHTGTYEIYAPIRQ